MGRGSLRRKSPFVLARGTRHSARKVTSLLRCQLLEEAKEWTTSWGRPAAHSKGLALFQYWERGQLSPRPLTKREEGHRESLGGITTQDVERSWAKLPDSCNHLLYRYLYFMPAYLSTVLHFLHFHFCFSLNFRIIPFKMQSLSPWQ